MSGIANWQAQIRIDIEDLKKRIKVAEGEIDNFTNEDRKVKLDIDTKTLESAIQKLDKMLDSLGKGTGDFKQFENLSKELSSIVSEVQSLSKAFGKVDDSGMKTLLSSIQNIDKSLSELSQNILNVNKNMSNMGGNTSGAVKQVENIGNAYQDATKEAEKLADAQSKIGQKSNISSGMKDAFPSTSDINNSDLSSLEDKIKSIFTDIKELEQILNSLNNGDYFTFDTSKNDDALGRVRELEKVLEEYGYKIKNFKDDSEAFNVSGAIVPSLEKENSSWDDNIKKVLEKQKLLRQNSPTTFIDETTQAIREENNALEETANKAKQAVSELVKSRDVVSQNWYREKGTVVGKDLKGNDITRDADEFSFVERLNNGQLQTVLATYNEETGKWVEQVINVRSAFEQVEKAIISADNKINSLENDRAKTLAAHPGYDTSADDALIASEKNHRDELQKTLDFYATEKEYVFEIEAANKRIIENQQRLSSISKKKENLRSAISDEQLNKDWDAAIVENNKRNAEAAKQLVKEFDDAWNEANKVNSALNETKNNIDSLSKIKELSTQFNDMKKKVNSLNSELVNGKITVSDYKNEVKSVTSEYSKMVSIQQNRDIEDYNANAKADNAKKLEQEKQIWNELATSLDRYATLRKRIASNNALSTDVEEVKNLKKHINDLKESDILPKDKLNIVDEKLQKINKTVTDLKAKLKESTLDSLQGSIDKYQKIYDQRSTYSSDFTPSEQYTKNLTELNTAIGNLVEYRNTLKKVSEVTVEQEAHLKGLVAACEKASDSFKSLSASEKGASQIAVDKLVQRINKDLDECTNYSKEAKLGLRALRDELESANPRNLKEITSEIINIENAEIKAGRAGRSFFDTLKNSGFHQLAAQMAGMFGFYDFINLGKEGLSVVRELNTALTEMRKVSDESLQSLKNYQNTTFDVADAVGTTAKQIQTSTADYMRLGESIDEAAESAKTANVLLNVSEFDNIEDATKSLVAMGQAYKDLDKMTIVDKLNEVGNNYAISTDELATALQKSAATLSLMGNTIDEAASLVTTANATIQDADSVSAGLRTISLRLVGTEEAEEELSAMNEEVDAFVKATNSKKQQIIKDYTAVASNNYQGFDILDSNGNYKNTYQILLGIAKVYKEIQEQDKKLGTNHATALIEELAGKNRSNIASAILQDPTQLEAVKKSSEEALGSAEKELNSYLDSIDGKMAQLENRAQEFWFKVIDSETIKNGIDLLSTLLKGATDFVDTIGLLPTILSGVGAALSFKNVGRDKMYSLSF